MPQAHRPWARATAWQQFATSQGDLRCPRQGRSLTAGPNTPTGHRKHAEPPQQRRVPATISIHVLSRSHSLQGTAASTDTGPGRHQIHAISDQKCGKAPGPLSTCFQATLCPSPPTSPRDTPADRVPCPVPRAGGAPSTRPSPQSWVLCPSPRWEGREGSTGGAPGEPQRCRGCPPVPTTP